MSDPITRQAHEPTLAQAPTYWLLVNGHNEDCAVRNVAFSACSCGACYCNLQGQIHSPLCTPDYAIRMCQATDVFGDLCSTFMVDGSVCADAITHEEVSLAIGRRDNGPAAFAFAEFNRRFLAERFALVVAEVQA